MPQCGDVVLRLCSQPLVHPISQGLGVFVEFSCIWICLILSLHDSTELKDVTPVPMDKPNLSPANSLRLGKGAGAKNIEVCNLNDAWLIQHPFL